MQPTRAAILSAIDDGPVSGPALADRLGVSRTAVWKHVEALREAGFDISSGEDGYVLRAVPEFGGAAIEYGLDAPYEVDYHDAIDSTNARARTMAADGAAEVVVVADRQTGGRGRLDREWASPSGGIWLSIVSRPDVPPARASLYTLAAAVATARTARSVGVPTGIKWPNDVLVGGRKLAGILTEMEGEADRVSWLVVGIGLNANVDPVDLPADAEATSLQSELGRPIDRRAVTQRLLETFADLVEHPDTILSAWRDLAVTLGQTVRVETPNGVVRGRARDVGPSGSLVVETETGDVEVTAGDCEHLRPRDN